MKTLLPLCSLLLGAQPCLADGPIGVAPSTQGREFVFYVSKSLGKNTGAPTYGLRLDQMSALPGMSEAATATLRRRELVNFAMKPQDGARIDFGRRLRWDLHTNRFGSF
jgi:hypothetical protein